jgi:hypothetical protein
MIAETHTEVDTAAEVTRFVECVFDPSDIVEVRLLPSGQSDWFRAPALADPANVERFQKLNDGGEHIFVGVNPRKGHGGRTAADVVCARCLWADFDDTITDAVRFKLSETTLSAPTMMVNSGHGVHCYWRLEESITDLGAWSQWQKDLAALLGSDSAVHDAPRLTRLPGFVNHKEPPAECFIIDADPERVYALCDLHGAIPSAVKPTTTPEVLTTDTRPQCDDLDAVAKAANYARKWEAVGEGQRNAEAMRRAADLTRDYALSDEQAWPILAAWNARNSPPLPDDELRKCLQNGRKHGKHPPGEKRLPLPVETPNAIAGQVDRHWPGPLDDAAYHGLAGEIVRFVEPHTEADPVAVLICFLVAFGNAAGRHAYFAADGVRHYANLFVVLIGETSKGRKGTAWARVMQRFTAVASEWAEHRVTGGLSSGEGLIWQVRDSIVTRKQEKARGKPAAMVNLVADAGVDDKRLMLVEAEFANVLKVTGREGNTLSPIIRKAWESGILRSLTKNSPARATGAHVSIVGHGTAEEIRRYLDRTESANGFANRFLWAGVRRSKCLPEGGHIGEDGFADLTPRIAAALSFASEDRLVVRDDAARSLWFEIYPELSEGKPGLAGALTGRAEAQVMRLALAYALLDCSPMIRVEHLTAAVALWEYCEASVVWCFGDAVGDSVADTILDALRKAGGDGVTRTELSHHFGRNVESDRITRGLNTLADRGLAVSKKFDTGGRPVERWYAKHGA